MRTNKFSFIGWLPFCCVMWASCDSNTSFREPQDSVDGYAVQSDLSRWEILRLDGKEAFEDIMITTDDGEQFNGQRLSFRDVSVSVNGFYRLGNYREGYSLLSKELDSDGQLIYLGPYQYVGMFYEDITPAVKKGESIIYINRKGEPVIDINKSTGLDVRLAYNFMGGLSVIAVTTEDGIPVYGAINTEGELVIEPKYYKLDYFGSGLYYAIAIDKYSDNSDVDILDNTGRVMFSFKEKSYHIRQSNGTTGPFYFTFKDGYGVLGDYSGYEWVIVNREGKELLESDGTKRIVAYSDCRSDKYFAFEDEEGGYGIMDIKGKVVIPAEYRSISWLDKEMFCGLLADGKMVVCDYKGKVLFSRKHDVMIPFKDNYSCVLTQGFCEFINKQGEIVNREVCYSGFNYYDEKLLDPVRSCIK